MSKNISIISSDGPNNTFIDGSNYDGSTIKIYDFWLPNNTGRILIDGFTIRNCFNEQNTGGAISNGEGPPEITAYDKVKLKNLIFENNFPRDIYWKGPGEYSIDNIISSGMVRVEYNNLTIKNSLINDFRTSYWSGEILNSTILGSTELINS